MDAKIRFDDADLEDVKRALGTRSDRAAIQAIVRTGLRVVKNGGKAQARKPRRKIQINPRSGDMSFHTRREFKSWLDTIPDRK